MLARVLGAHLEIVPLFGAQEEQMPCLTDDWLALRRAAGELNPRNVRGARQPPLGCRPARALLCIPRRYAANLPAPMAGSSGGNIPLFGNQIRTSVPLIPRLLIRGGFGSMASTRSANRGIGFGPGKLCLRRSSTCSGINAFFVDEVFESQFLKSCCLFMRFQFSLMVT